MKLRNPLEFRHGPVNFFTTVIYLALIVPLLYVHETVPSPPAEEALSSGLSLSEAWRDLLNITREFHPYNSRANEQVREFLMERSRQILTRNNIHYTTELAGGVVWDDSLGQSYSSSPENTVPPTARAPGATLFDDRISNVTWTIDSLINSRNDKSSASWSGHYFEGNNFYVYIHGKDDPEGDWWTSKSSAANFRGSGGVLVNCHFDSVSTGYGATDNGMSCVTMLQLLSYFTMEGRQPKNGIVLLFNNAEEDGLLGARAFGYSPLLKFCHTFVNLEGAGAGGRAILFRTTDLQSAQVYGKSPYPFGSVVAANAFERGVIKSGTDFEVFDRDFGQRGLDIAFYAPRSRYHTEDDDARHTSVRSIWHMLSAALASTERFSQITGTVFNGDRSDGKSNLIQNGKKTEGVWFDLLGRAWAAFPLRGLFAWSLALLIATPLVLTIVTYMLIRKDKYYFFAKDIKLDSELDDPVSLGGWKGFFRFPLAFVFAIGLTVASVLIVAKFNPLIIYSSGYAVWAMTISIFYFSFWLIVRGASFVRPSALHRGFVLVWLFIFSWALQVLAAIAEDRMHIGALYFAAFYHTSIFLALLISLLEQFALPGKHEFARQFTDASEDQDESVTASIHDAQGTADEGGNDDDDPSETTPLRSGERGYGANDQTTFANNYRRSIPAEDEQPSTTKVRSYPPYEYEQAWSGRLPTWTWILQFLILAPVHVLIIGNLGLMQMSAMNMTGSDGSGLLAPLMGIGIMAIMLLLPLTPFMHRVTHHIPMFLLLVFIGSFIYNLAAFPFSVNNRYKVYFRQIVNVNDGTDVVNLLGLEEFIKPVLASLPSVASQDVDCGSGSDKRPSLMSCTYDSSSQPAYLANGTKYADLITVSTIKSSDGKSANLVIDALETKMCILELSKPVFGFAVKNGGPRDRRFGSFPRSGLKQINLWRRDLTIPWDVKLQLTEDGHSLSHEVETRDEPLSVTVKCAYSDANDAKTIPTLQELKQFSPKWTVFTKATVALVEVQKKFEIR